MRTDYWLGYPSEYRKQLKPLLHQQMWLFGQDIIFPNGNLLYRYQFTHKRPANRGSAMYIREDETKQIVLWGWGIWFGEIGTGAIFVNRFKAKPQFTPHYSLNDPVHSEDGLPHRSCRVSSMARAQSVRHLWAELLAWIGAYEAWVLATAGEGWRQSALRAFNHAVTKPKHASSISGQWQSLSNRGYTLPIKSYTRLGQSI